MNTTYRRLRKNAKELKMLVQSSTKIVLREAHSNVDDSPSHTRSIATAADVFAKLDKNSDWYQDLYCRVEENEKGEPIELVIADQLYPFTDRFIITFAPIKPAKIKTETVESINEVKPRMTLKAVQAYLKAGFVSPLNHGAKHTEQAENDFKQITKVVVRFTESSEINSTMERNEKGGQIAREISIDEYNRLAWLSVARQRKYVKANNGKGYGYDKTFLELTLANGQMVEFGHYVSIKEPNLQQAWSNYVDYCLQEAEQQAANIH